MKNWKKRSLSGNELVVHFNLQTDLSGLVAYVGRRMQSVRFMDELESAVYSNERNHTTPLISIT